MKFYGSYLFERLAYEFQKHTITGQQDVEQILTEPFLQDSSFQLLLITPSGQTYIHDYYQGSNRNAKAITLPQTAKQQGLNLYQIDNQKSHTEKKSSP